MDSLVAILIFHSLYFTNTLATHLRHASHSGLHHTEHLFLIHLRTLLLPLLVLLHHLHHFLVHLSFTLLLLTKHLGFFNLTRSHHLSHFSLSDSIKTCHIFHVSGSYLLLSHTSLSLDAKFFGLLLHLFKLTFVILHLRHVFASNGGFTFQNIHIVHLLSPALLAFKFGFLLFQ